jgi:hypothetical protein
MYMKKGSWSLTATRLPGNVGLLTRVLVETVALTSVWTAFSRISSTDSHNWMTWLGRGLLPTWCSKDFGRGFPQPIRRA